MTFITYGTPAQVAAFSSYTRNGAFFDEVVAVPADPLAVPPVAGSPAVKATHPSLTQITSWLTTVSRLMDLALAQNWFDIPIDTTKTEAISTIAGQVVQVVADMGDDANSTGRFTYGRYAKSGRSNTDIISDEFTLWVKSNEAGLIAMGLTQNKKIGGTVTIEIGVLSRTDDPYRPKARLGD